jgi:uncharacterized membrane protein YgcG
MLNCMGGDCDGGACCATLSIATFGITSNCSATCTISATTYELCATAKDCPSGYTCGPNPLGTGPNICTAGTSSSSSGGGDGGGSSSGGGSDAGDGGGSSSGGDAGGSDAPTG